jgi:integrase
MATQVSGHVKLVKRKRGDQWYVKFRLPSGRQVQRKLGPAWTERSRPPAGYYTKRTAREALHAILTDARRGTLAGMEATGATFGDACAEWLRYVEHDLQRASSTVRDYRNTVNGRLLPAFGADTPLEAITTERIDSYRSELLSEVSRRTGQKVLVLLHGVLKRAKRKKWIASNPAEDAERVAVDRSGEFNVLSVEQVEAVARAADDEQISAAVVVAAYTGLRTGELRALRWRDVSFAAANLHVRRNLPTNGSGEEKAPKGKRVRSVPLMDDAARALDGLSRREFFTDPDHYVFCGEVGGPLPECALRDGLYAAMEAVGIDRAGFPVKPGFRFHDLRHTFGTLAAQIYPIVDVQAYMGHADIQTTMMYVHHVPKVNAAAQFSEFVAAQKADVSPTVSRNAKFDGNRAQLSATHDA